MGIGSLDRLLGRIMNTRYSKPKVLFCIVASVFIMIVGAMPSCDMTYNLSNAWIPLPVFFKGERMVIACTSGIHRSIHPFVPSYVTHVYWDEDVFLAKIHPMKTTKVYPNGMNSETPDRTVFNWYVFDLQNKKAWYCSTKKEYAVALEKLELDPTKIKLLTLKQAWKKSEEELGFQFNRKSASQFLRKEGFFESRTLPRGARPGAPRMLEVEKWDNSP